MNSNRITQSPSLVQVKEDKTQATDGFASALTNGSSPTNNKTSLSSVTSNNIQNKNATSNQLQTNSYYSTSKSYLPL